MKDYIFFFIAFIVAFVPLGIPDAIIISVMLLYMFGESILESYKFRKERQRGSKK